MATKNRNSGKRREKQEEERTPNHQGEEQSDEETDSDSDSAAAPLVPPKKPKFIRPPEPEPEPVENGSACSSPSASGFIIMPAVKPCGDKKKGASASKVFGNDDVITLLERLSDFWVNGKNNKWAEFHLFVKDDLRNHFTKTQVSEKIRSLKRRFLTLSERARANGGIPDLSDPHELVVFELSKALWGDEKSIAPEKGQIAEINVDEEADEITRERKVVSENEEGSNNVKKQKQVCENGEGSKSTKKRKKRKQLGEHGKGSKKTRKQEHGIRELLEEEEEGDLRDAAITIMSIRNQVGKNGEGNEEMRKGEQVNELDDKELLKEGIQVDELDDKELPKEGIQVDELDDKELLKEVIQADELDDKELPQEGIQVDELDDKELPQEGIQVNGHDEAAKIPSKKKRGDEYRERKRKMKKRKAKERDEAKKTARAQKEVDEHVGKKESLKEVNQHDEDEDEELMNEGKQADEYDEQNVTTRKQKQIDGHEVKKDFAKQGKQVDDDHEEENIPAIQKQTKISAEEFQSSYPLLCASFDIYGFPMFTKEICLMIGQENLQELERKWWEINDEMHHLGLKKLQLMKRDFNARVQGKC